MSVDYSPLEFARKADRKAWVIIIFMLMGSLFGWTIHKMLAPVYESSATITTNIDSSLTGMLSDITEDQAIVTVGDLIASPETVGKITEHTANKTYLTEPIEIGRNLFLDRAGYRWSLRVRSVNAIESAELANTWAESAIMVLEEASNHADLVAAYQAKIDALVQCVEVTAEKLPAVPICGYQTIEELQRQLGDLNQILQSETKKSQGMHPAMAVAITRTAELPTRPSIHKQGMMVFAGAMIGFIFGLIWIEIPIKQLKKHNAK